MADMTLDCALEKRPKREELTRLYEAADMAGDWESLKPFPYLLWMWQVKHEKDLRNISLFVAHHRLDKHNRCRKNCTNRNYWYEEEPVKSEQISMNLQSDGVSVPATIPTGIDGQPESA